MMNAAHETRLVVEEYYRRLESGRTASAGELFADEVDWNVYGPDEVPWTGRRTRHDQIEKFFADFPQHVQKNEFTVSKMLVDGADAIALGNLEYIIKLTGKIFSSPFAFHFTVENSKIVRYHAYEDSLAMARSFDLA
jgi:ketosteroid isomerase-like protein